MIIRHGHKFTNTIWSYLLKTYLAVRSLATDPRWSFCPAIHSSCSCAIVSSVFFPWSIHMDVHVCRSRHLHANTLSLSLWNGLDWSWNPEPSQMPLFKRSRHRGGQYLRFGCDRSWGVFDDRVMSQKVWYVFGGISVFSRSKHGLVMLRRCLLDYQ